MRNLRVVLSATGLLVFGLHANAEIQYPQVQSMEGHYRGNDPLKKECLVDILREGDVLNVRVHSEVYGDFSFLNVSIRNLQNQIVEDTEWRQREDRNFDPDVINVNFNRVVGPTSMFGGPSESLEAFWHSGQLSLISIDEQSGSGPFIGPSDRRSIMCFDLKGIGI